MKTITDRIPFDLFNLKKRISKELNLSKGVDAYQVISDITKPIIFPRFFKKKKGQLFEIISFSVLIMVFVLMIGIMFVIIKASNDALAINEPDTEIIARMDNYETSAANWWDFSFGLFFFMAMFFLIAISLFLGTNLLFATMYFILLIVLGFIFVAIHNAVNTILEAFPTVFSSFPIVTFIVEKFYFILVIFYLISILTLFIKVKSSEAIQTA